MTPTLRTVVRDAAIVYGLTFACGLATAIAFGIQTASAWILSSLTIFLMAAVGGSFVIILSFRPHPNVDTRIRHTQSSSTLAEATLSQRPNSELDSIAGTAM